MYTNNWFNKLKKQQNIKIGRDYSEEYDSEQNQSSKAFDYLKNNYYTIIPIICKKMKQIVSKNNLNINLLSGTELYIIDFINETMVDKMQNGINKNIGSKETQQTSKDIISLIEKNNFFQLKDEFYKKFHINAEEKQSQDKTITKLMTEYKNVIPKLINRMQNFINGSITLKDFNKQESFIINTLTKETIDDLDKYKRQIKEEDLYKTMENFINFMRSSNFLEIREQLQRKINNDKNQPKDYNNQNYKMN